MTNKDSLRKRPPIPVGVSTPQPAGSAARSDSFVLGQSLPESASGSLSGVPSVPRSGAAPQGSVPGSLGRQSAVPESDVQLREEFVAGTRTRSGFIPRARAGAAGFDASAGHGLSVWCSGLRGLSQSGDGSSTSRAALRGALAERLKLTPADPDYAELLNIGSAGQAGRLLVLLLADGGSLELVSCPIAEVPAAVDVALGVLGGQAMHGATLPDDQPLLPESARVYAARLNAWLGLYARSEVLSPEGPLSQRASLLEELQELGDLAPPHSTARSRQELIEQLSGLALDRVVTLRLE